MYKRLKHFMCVVAVLTITSKLDATHIRGGFIQAKRGDLLSLTYQFTFVGFRDTDSGIQFGSGTFDFGDGDSKTGDFIISETQLSPNVVRAEFTVVHTYASQGEYVISYREEFRNRGIANMENSVNTAFYVEMMVRVDDAVGVNSTPALLSPTVLEATAGRTYFSIAEIEEEDGDDLQFETEIPQQARDVVTTNYEFPTNPKFYSNFSAGNELGTGPPTLTLGRFSGLLTWDSPGDFLNLSDQDCPAGASNCAEYVIAYRINEFRRINGVRTLISSTVVDSQIIVVEEEESEVLKIAPRISFSGGECEVFTEPIQFTIDSEEAYSVVLSPVELIATVNGEPLDAIDLNNLVHENTFEITFNELDRDRYIYIQVVDDDGLVRSAFGTLLSPDCEFINNLVTSVPPSASRFAPTIYPNPIGDYLRWNAEQRFQRFEIMDLRGGAVKSGAIEKEQAVSTQDLPQGMYFLRLWSDDVFFDQRFIK
ncbi:MAG: T9SS type A sorting domain-containing protein [Bacteroidota bacterium]